MQRRRNRFNSSLFAAALLAAALEAPAAERPGTLNSAGLSVRMLYPGLTGRSGSCEQDTSFSPAGRKVDSWRLAIIGGTLVTGMAAIHIYQQNGWWKDNRAPFHFREDLVYGLGVDKIGHAYGASVLATLIGRAVAWADVPEWPSLMIGAGASLLFQTYIELEDGFSAWGFDRVDFACDVAGAVLPLVRHRVTPLRSFDLKLSYLPSELINNPGGTGFQGQRHLMMDDYEGQTFWLSAKMADLLPQSLKTYWPDFLCLAIGYGARDVAAQGSEPYRVYFLGLDYDMTKLLPQETPFLRTLAEALNFIHFPAPAVRISPSAIWYGLYF